MLTYCHSLCPLLYIVNHYSRIYYKSIMKRWRKATYNQEQIGWPVMDQLCLASCISSTVPY